MASDSYLCRVVPEESFAAWDALVSKSPNGTIYSTAGYLDILCRATGGAFSILGIFHGEQLVGGVGLYRQTSAGGTSISNRLLLYYNGIVLSDIREAKIPEAHGALLATLKEMKLHSILLHTPGDVRDYRAFLQGGWQVHPAYTYIAHIKDLNALSGRMDKNTRRQIRRAEEAGTQFCEDEEFDAFYDLHEVTASRKNLGCYLPRQTFKNYFQALRNTGSCVLYTARSASGEPLSSELVLTGPFKSSQTVCAGTAADGLAQGATAFLRLKTFEDLSKKGFMTNDLTDASINSVSRFKADLGAELTMNFVVKSPEAHGASLLHKIPRRIGRLFSRGKR